MKDEPGPVSEGQRDVPSPAFGQGHLEPREEVQLAWVLLA